MRVSKYLKYVFGVTVLALTYIHMQMQIIALAYMGKQKEKNIRNLTEENGHLTYSILTLTAAKHLGGQLLNDKSKMHFIDKDNIVRVAVQESKVNLKPSDIYKDKTKKDSNPLLSLLSFNNLNSR